jgi:uncharacterized protein YjeT (DUF2065 family)
MFEDLVTAFALVLVLEGLGPGLAPGLWRKYMGDMSRMDPKTLRIAGVVSIVAGALLFQWIN